METLVLLVSWTISFPFQHIHLRSPELSAFEAELDFIHMIKYY